MLRLVRRPACEQCCLSAPPEPDQINDVIASHIYLLAQRGLAASPANGDRAVDRARRARAGHERPQDPLGHPQHHPVGRARLQPDSQRRTIIDAGCQRRHVRAASARTESRLRTSGTGTASGFRSWGISAETTMGMTSFRRHSEPSSSGLSEYAAGLWPRNSRFYMGLHGRHGIILEDAIRRYLIENGIAYRIHWVGDNLFARGVRDFSTLRFLEAVKDFSGPKTLVGNRSLSPVAAGLRVPPRRDSPHRLPS